MGSDAVRGIFVEGAGEASFDRDKLRRAFALLESWTTEGIVPGAAALVARGGRVAGEAYLGLAHRQKGIHANSDTMWALASISKPVTATAVMMLVEEGLISLDEPLYRLMPELMDAPDGPFDRRAVTLRQMLAHTSGLPGLSEDDMPLRAEHRPIEDFVKGMLRQPLRFVPGTQFLYSNAGITLAAEAVGRALEGTLGQRVERPAIRHFFTFTEERIFAPLGMRSSSFTPPESWDERIAWVEETGQEGLDWETQNSSYMRRLGLPSGGMYGNPRDLVRLVDLFLPQAGGMQRIGLAGVCPVRLVSPATARAMTSVQYAVPGASNVQMQLGACTTGLPAFEWGIGFEVKGQKRPHRSGELTSRGTFGWIGSSGTCTWADPELDLTLVLMTNRQLRSGWTAERNRMALFSNAVVAAAR